MTNSRAETEALLLGSFASSSPGSFLLQPSVLGWVESEFQSHASLLFPVFSSVLTSVSGQSYWVHVKTQTQGDVTQLWTASCFGDLASSQRDAKVKKITFLWQFPQSEMLVPAFGFFPPSVHPCCLWKMNHVTHSHTNGEVVWG